MSNDLHPSVELGSVVKVNGTTARIEPASESSGTVTGFTTGVSVEYDLGQATTPSQQDQWSLWQQRKRRRHQDASAPVIESEFARLARLAATE